MEKAPGGTSVGVDDPYEFVDRCDHLTDEGRCRFAVERGHDDPEFATDRSAEDFTCPVAGNSKEAGLTGPWDWSDCPHFRRRAHDRECVRCGLEERLLAHSDERPLLEEHHLSYTNQTNSREGETSHEITVFLCRWCHATVHRSWARIDDDVSPDPEAVAALEGRRTRERDELGFTSAAERYEN